MARRSDSPQAPVVSAPDLPERLGVAYPAAHADVVAARIDLDGHVDLAHASVDQSVIAGACDDLDLSGATLIDVEMNDVRCSRVRARSATLRRVRITGGRIGTLELSEARIGELELRHVRVDYLSFAGSRVEDAAFSDCVFTTLDMPQAELSRVAFSSCRAEEVDSRALRATHLDLRGLDALSYLDVAALRGAVLTAQQVGLLAPALAAALGIDIRD